MKGLVIIISAIVVLIIALVIIFVTVFYPKLEEVNQIKQWGEDCSYFVYGSAWETAHGGSPCYHVSVEAFRNNNSVICNYLKDEFDKAKCLGLSAERWEDRKICSSLSKNNKEVCTLNILYKLKNIGSIESLKETDICKDISNQTLKSVCRGYKGVITSNYSLCKEDNTTDEICRGYFLLYNKNPLVSKEICEETFIDPKDLFNCYQYSTAINLTFLPEKTILFENISIVDGKERLTNHSLSFSVLNINSDYPYKMVYSISYWDKNSYYSGQYGTSEYLYHLVGVQYYLCRTTINSINEINNSCLSGIDISYDTVNNLIHNSFPTGSWSYYQF